MKLTIAVLSLFLIAIICAIIGECNNEYKQSDSRITGELVFYYDGYGMDFNMLARNKFILKPIHKVLVITFYKNHYTLSDDTWFKENECFGMR